MIINNTTHLGGLMLGYWMYYYEAWVLPALMRQEKMQYAWNAAYKKYHENIWKVNHGYDRELRWVGRAGFSCGNGG